MHGYFSKDCVESVRALLHDYLDFTRCVRPNGTAYGTSGKCRIGVESDLPRDDKAIRETVRALRKQDPEELAKQWVEKRNAGIWPNKLPSNLKMAKELADNTPSSETAGLPPELRKSGERLRDLYDRIRVIKEAKLPSGEEDWRVDEVNRDIYKLRKAGLESPHSKQFESMDWELSLRSKKPEELRSDMSRFKYDLFQSIAKGEDTSDITSRLRKIISKLPEKWERANEKYELDATLGLVKPAKEGSYAETLKMGQKVMSQHDERFKSYSSIIRRSHDIEASLREKLAKLSEEGQTGKLKERMRIKRAIFELGSKRLRAEKGFAERMESLRGELLKTHLTDERIDNLLDRVQFVDKSKSKGVESETRSQMKEFVKMFNGKGLEDVADSKESLSIHKGLKRYNHDPSMRAFAHIEAGQVTSNGQKHILFHEIGHIVEAQRPWLQENAVQWRDKKAFTVRDVQDGKGDEWVKDVPYALRKTGDDKEVPVFRLSEMPRLKRANYEPNEIAVVDTFLSPYIGKVYDGSITEVVSSLIEHFSDATRMAHLYRSHPDLFTLGVGLTQTR